MSGNPLGQSKWEIEAELRVEHAVANAKRLDTELRKIEEHIKDIVNADLAPKNTPVSTFQQARAFLTPENIAKDPALAALVQGHQQRGSELAGEAHGRLQQGGLLPGAPGYLKPGSTEHQRAAKQYDATLSAQDKLAKSYEAEIKARDALAKTAQDAANEERKHQETLRRSSFGHQLQSRILSSRSLSALGAFATGDTGALGHTLAQSFVQALMNSRPSTIPGVGLGMKVANSLGGMAGMGGTAGAAEGAAGGAEAGLGSVVMSNPISAGIAALLAATVGVVAGANVKQARDNVQMQNLRAAIGGVGGNADLGETSNAFGQGGIRGGGAQALYNRIYGASHRFFPGQDEKVAFQMSAGMGLQGVTAQQMLGGGGQASAVNVALAAARNTGMDPGAAGGYVATLMTKGGQSAQQVADSFRDLGQAADKTGIPMNRLLDSMQALTQASGGTAVNVMSLAATQSIVSKQVAAGVNAGQIVSPIMGATGFQAYGMAAMLNMTPGQFTAMQTGQGKGGNVAMGMDKLSQFVKQNFGGMNPMLQAGALQATGMVDMSGMSDENQQKLMHLLSTGQTGQFEKEAAKLIKDAGKDKGKDWQDRMANVAKQETTFLDQLKNFLQDLKKALGEFAGALTGLTHALDSLKGLLTTLWNFLKNAIAKLFPSATPPAGSQAADAAKLLQDLKDKDRQAQGTQTTLKQAEQHGLGVRQRKGATAELGGTVQLSGAEVKALEQISKKTGVPLAVLASVEGTESGGQNVNQGKDMGYGRFQFDFSTAGNAKASMDWLNMAAKKLGVKQVTTKEGAETLAMNEPVERLAAGYRLMDLYQRSNNNWQSALGSYNGSDSYGTAVWAGAQQVEITLGGTIAPDGTVHVPKTKVKVDPHRHPPGPGGRKRPAVKHPTPPTRQNGRAGQRTTPSNPILDASGESGALGGTNPLR